MKTYYLIIELELRHHCRVPISVGNVQICDQRSHPDNILLFFMSTVTSLVIIFSAFESENM